MPTLEMVQVVDNEWVLYRLGNLEIMRHVRPIKWETPEEINIEGETSNS